MTGTAGPLSLPQIEAQALAVLERAGDARVIAIQARTQAAWPETITLVGRPFRLRWCQSPLMARAALSALEEETAEPVGAGLILLTPLAARELGCDVVARLARAQVFQPDAWGMVQQLFAAREVDALLSRCRWMAKAAGKRGIIVTNVPGYSSPAVAQLVFSLMLELTNNVGHHAQTVRDGRWVACPDFCYWDHPIIELNGRTLGIVGYGDIGSSVARIAVAFGMKVLASKREWKTPPPQGVTPASIDEVFQNSDFISLHCPLTDATKHLVGERTLSLMKPTSFIINTGRGPLVDEAALAQALNTGGIAGAGLDVLSVDPLKAGNPLLSAKNCVITPHIGWASREARVRLIDVLASNLRAFLEGRAGVRTDQRVSAVLATIRDGIWIITPTPFA